MSLLGGKFGANKLGAKQVINDPYVERAQKIVDAYDPKKEGYRFYTVVYNSIIEKKSTFGTSNFSFGQNKQTGAKTSAFGTGSACPPFISSSEWQSFNKLAGDEFKPDVLKGQAELDARKKSQMEIIGKMNTKIDEMQNRIAKIEEDYRGFKKGGMRGLIENNKKIIELVMKKICVKELNALKMQQFSKEEQELIDKLETINANINKPNQYVSQMNKIKLLSKLIDDSNEAVSQTKVIDKNRTNEINTLLENNTKSIQAMTEVIKSLQIICSVQEKLLSQQQ